MRSFEGALAGRRRSAWANQFAALAGASRAAPSSRLAQNGNCAEVALARGAFDMVCARSGGRAARPASKSAQRSCAPSRQPPGVASYTARRMSGCRKRKRRGDLCAPDEVEQQ